MRIIDNLSKPSISYNNLQDIPVGSVFRNVNDSEWNIFLRLHQGYVNLKTNHYYPETVGRVRADSIILDDVAVVLGVK